MDRTTLGRNIVPLQRRRLIVARTGREDRRSKELQLTKTGLSRLDATSKEWAKAPAQFEATLGREQASELRGLLRAVVGSDFRRPSQSATASTSVT
jgi:DNA-binding MarR family transcriptional regulator